MDINANYQSHANHAAHHGGGKYVRNHADRQGLSTPANTLFICTDQVELGSLSGVEPTEKKDGNGTVSATQDATAKGFTAENLGVQIYEDGSYGVTGSGLHFGITLDGMEGSITISAEDIRKIFENGAEYKKAFDTGDGSYTDPLQKEKAVSRFMKGDTSGPNGEDSFYIKKDGKLVKVDKALLDKIAGHEFSEFNAKDRKAVKEYFDGTELYTEKAKTIENLADKTPADKKYYTYNKDTKSYVEIDRSFVDDLKEKGIDVKQFLADKKIYEVNPDRKNPTRELAKIMSEQIQAQFMLGDEDKNIASASGDGIITFRKTGSVITLSNMPEGIEILDQKENEGNTHAQANAKLIDEIMKKWNEKQKNYAANLEMMKTTMATLQAQQADFEFATAGG